jgi:hypothetical protein
MNRNTRISSLISLAKSFFVTVTRAQSTEWETLDAEVGRLFMESIYDRAVVVAKKALEVAETLAPTIWQRHWRT